MKYKIMLITIICNTGYIMNAVHENCTLYDTFKKHKNICIKINNKQDDKIYQTTKDVNNLQRQYAATRFVLNDHETKLNDHTDVLNNHTDVLRTHNDEIDRIKTFLPNTNRNFNNNYNTNQDMNNNIYPLIQLVREMNTTVLQLNNRMHIMGNILEKCINIQEELIKKIDNLTIDVALSNNLSHLSTSEEHQSSDSQNTNE